MHMSDKKTVLPKLRFQEFNSYPEWEITTLGAISEPIEEKVGSKNCILMSVTAGKGLVPQKEKFGREIAGNSYKNYYIIRKNDFAYNKSSTKQFPEGYIAMLEDYHEAALPNSIFICFRITDTECVPDFINQLFQSNYHGKWLRKYIEVGARAHGSLNVDCNYLWNMPIALPAKKEQKKIVEVLSEIDKLIISEISKLDVLKKHKIGLLQSLFPTDENKNPNQRFHDYLKSGMWKHVKLSDIADRVILKNKDNSIKRVLTNSAINGVVAQNEYFDRKIVSGNNLSNYYVIEKGDYVYNPRISTLAPVGPISKNKIGRGIMSPLYTIFRFKEEDHGFYEYYFKTTLWHKYINSKSNTGARHDRINISTEDFMEMPVPVCPDPKEQQKIAIFLKSMDILIFEQENRIRMLQSHKKGLIVELFPSIEEVLK